MHGLVEYEPNIVFASVEHINEIPFKEMEKTKFVLWGQYYRENHFEKDTVSISNKTKKAILECSRKHDMLVWSQHSDEINDKYFSGYTEELGVKFTQLMHCADSTKLKPILKTVQLKNDILWIGKIKHRKDSYAQYFAPLKELTQSYLDFNEYKPIDPRENDISELFQFSKIAPNIHTTAQRDYKLLLNERTFITPIFGGFQINDNDLAKKYFDNDELIIESNPKNFIDAVKHFLEQPEERVNFINKAREKILREHTYFNRIEKIFNELNMEFPFEKIHK